MKYIRSYFKLNIDKSENKSSEETKKRPSDSSRNISIDNELSEDSKIVHENNSIEHREDSILSTQTIDSSDDDNIYDEIMLRLSIKKDKKCLWTPLEEEYLNDEINSKDFDQNDWNEYAKHYLNIKRRNSHISFQNFMMFIEQRQLIYEYKIVEMVHGCINKDYIKNSFGVQDEENNIPLILSVTKYNSIALEINLEYIKEDLISASVGLILIANYIYLTGFWKLKTRHMKDCLILLLKIKDCLSTKYQKFFSHWN